MRILLLTLMLSLLTSASGAFAVEKRFSASPGLTSKALRVAPQQPAYQMLCRGSDAGALFNSVGSRPASSGETIVTYDLVFTPSPQAAGANARGLEPGQCSWIDRPVNDREPYIIRFETPFNAQLKKKLHGTPVDSSPTAAERYPDSFTIPAYMKSKNRYWSFLVYNTGKGYLLATGGKHFKPTIGIEDRIRIPNGKVIKQRDRIAIPKP